MIDHIGFHHDEIDGAITIIAEINLCKRGLQLVEPNNFIRNTKLNRTCLSYPCSHIMLYQLLKLISC